MIEDESRSRPEQSNGDGYVYDYFKFMTSLSLLTLAGIFAISQMEGALEQIGKPTLLMVMAAVAIGGMASFSGASHVVQQQMTGVSGKRMIAILMKVAPAFYGIGVGASLMMFLDVMY